MFGDLNPIRYKGYYFDTETGFYWINNRYYDPETGRFISAACPTTLDETSGVINGTNLYIAHRNNPTMFPLEAVQVPAIDLIGDNKDTNGFKNIFNVLPDIGNELNLLKNAFDHSDKLVGGIDAMRKNKLPTWFTKSLSWVTTGLNAFSDIYDNFTKPYKDLNEILGHSVLDVLFRIGSTLATNWVGTIVGGLVGGIPGAILGFSVGLVLDAILEKFWEIFEDKLYRWIFES